MKRCSRCGDFKLRPAFVGADFYCRVCRSQYNAAYFSRPRRKTAYVRPTRAKAKAVDPWAELGPIYRRRTKKGRMGVMSRLNRTASKIIAVLDRTGTLMSPTDYALRPFSGRRTGYGGKCIYFRRPVMTAGLTVLFEGKNT